MDAGADWKDFHFLNTAMIEAAENNPGVIDASRVQLTIRSKSWNVNWMTALDGLVIEYSVQAPLNYVFNRQAMRSYNSMFAFLVKIQRAKTSLERISFRAFKLGPTNAKRGFKIFWGTRSKLLWFMK